VTDNGIVYQVKVAEPFEYGEEYFTRYCEYRGSKASLCIVGARIEMVKRFGDGDVLDVGVGNGEFLEHLNREGIRCFGYDINPHAVEMLKERGDFLLPGSATVRTATFWDTLEHIPDPASFLGLVDATRVLMSIPIYSSVDSLLSWKHFKPGEHLYYFTEEALVTYMGDLGYEAIYVGRPEEKCGRQDIMSFAFSRR